MIVPDPLHRFVVAQARNLDQAEQEIRTGQKLSHWMWYVYPQLRGLGRSNFAHLYGLTGPVEASAYLAHPLLGPRLLHMCQLLLTHKDRTAPEILDQIDAMKLRSCATLFASLPRTDPVFQEVLDHFFNGQPCPGTVALLDGEKGGLSAPL